MILTQDLLLPDGVNTTFDGTTAWYWVGQGAADADSPPTNVLNHFYDPTTERGLLAYQSSLVHAWFDTTDGWLGARHAYADWLTQPDSADREAAGKKLFVALGHVIHLLQDAGQPQHTRSDWHLTWVPGQGSAFEAYCSAHYQIYEQLQALPIASVPVFPSLNPLPPNGVPATFASFWDTLQSPQLSQVSFIQDDHGARYAFGFFGDLGLAEYSNFYFVTDDTMFTQNTQTMFTGSSGQRWLVTLDDTNPLHALSTAINAYRSPALEHTDLASVLVRTQPITLARQTLHRYGQNMPAGSSPSIPVRLHVGKNGDDGEVDIDPLFKVTVDGTNADGSPIYNRIGFDADCYAAHARLLLPKAISYSTGLLNYFFRGRLSVQQQWDPTRHLNVIHITNSSSEPFFEGSWDLLRDDANGNRSSVGGADFSNYFALGALGIGDTFEATFPEDLSVGKYYLVYRGAMGDEVDMDEVNGHCAIAAKAFLPAAETWRGQCFMPAIDGGCDGCHCDGCNVNITVQFFHQLGDQVGDIRAHSQYDGACIAGGSTGVTSLETGFDGTNLDVFNIRGRVVGWTLQDGVSYHWYCLQCPPCGERSFPFSIQRVE